MSIISIKVLTTLKECSHSSPQKNDFTLPISKQQYSLPTPPSPHQQTSLLRPIHPSKKGFSPPTNLNTSLSALDANIDIEVQKAHTENALHFLLQEWNPHILVIDLSMFPIKLIECVRKQPHQLFLGIIACGHKLTPHEEILCFNYGADDLIPLRHESWQINCRIHAIMQRMERWQEHSKNLQIHNKLFHGQRQLLSFNNICLDTKKYTVKVAGKAIHTTPTQFRLLQVFISYPNTLLTRSWLQTNVWSHLKISARSIDAHISKLKKIFPSLDHHLISIYGKGYRLSPGKSLKKAS